MPRKNIYVRDEDQDVWERAEKLADGDSISAIVTEALRQFVLHREQSSGTGLYERQELEIASVDQRLNAIDGERKIAFQGRLLVSDDLYDVYETAKHQLLFYWVDSGYGFYKVYPSISSASADTDPRTGKKRYSGELMTDIADELEQEWIEELDI